jgi:COMPASS component SWD3
MVHEDNPAVTSVCFAPNGRYVLAFSMDSCIRLWDYVSGSVKKTYQGHSNSSYSIGGCFGCVDSITSTAAFVAAASEDGDVVLWDVSSKQIIQRIERAHDGVCFWVDVNGHTMVSCGQDGRIKVFRHMGPEEEAEEAEKKRRAITNGTNGNKNGHVANSTAEPETRNGNVPEQAVEGSNAHADDGAMVRRSEESETSLKEEADIKKEY